MHVSGTKVNIPQIPLHLRILYYGQPISLTYLFFLCSSRRRKKYGTQSVRFQVKVVGYVSFAHFSLNTSERGVCLFSWG